MSSQGADHNFSPNGRNRRLIRDMALVVVGNSHEYHLNSCGCFFIDKELKYICEKHKEEFKEVRE